MSTVEDDDARAGEYVLGLMDDAERIGFQARIAADPGLARSVDAWRARFSELDATAPPVQPSAGLWPQIEASLGIAPAEVIRPAWKRGLRPAAVWDDVRFWRMASLAACILLAVSFVGFGRPSPQPSFIAVLQGADASPTAIVEAFNDGRLVLLPLQDFDVPAGRIIQVWTIADPAQGPVSVGLLPEVSRAVFDPAHLPSARGQQLFELTLEPAGGSPTGKPTGPILGKGLTLRAH